MRRKPNARRQRRRDKARRRRAKHRHGATDTIVRAARDRAPSPLLANILAALSRTRRSPMP